MHLVEGSISNSVKNGRRQFSRGKNQSISLESGSFIVDQL